MAEYIEREKTIKTLCNMCAVTPTEEHMVERCVEAIDYIPAADVVEVVRCKDCMHCVVREYDIIDELECEFYDVFTDPFDYCSKGERRE